MKCPYCGIHYEDSERECPVCGKRPGLFAPKKKSKFSASEPEDRPSPKKAKSASSTARKQTYNHKKPDSAEDAWQRAAAGAHSHDDPLSAAPRGQKKKASGCLIAVVVFILFFFILFIFSIVSFRAVTHSAANWLDDTFLSEDYEDYDDIYEYCDPSEAFPLGTWVNDDASVTMAVDSESTFSWTNGIEVFTDEYALFERLALTAGNAGDHCSEEELARYPIEDYTLYTLYASCWDEESDDSPILSICMYIPNDTDTAALTSFDYYDYETGEYHTFTFVSNATALPEPVVTGQQFA